MAVSPAMIYLDHYSNTYKDSYGNRYDRQGKLMDQDYYDKQMAYAQMQAMQNAYSQNRLMSGGAGGSGGVSVSHATLRGDGVGISGVSTPAIPDKRLLLLEDTP